MTHVVAFTVLLAVAAGWMLLPFLPAIRELVRPTDAMPLGMVGRDAGDITYFAQGFRQFVDRQAALAPSAPHGAVGVLADGSRYARVTSDAAWAALPRGAAREVTALVVVDAPLALPDGAVFAAEVYARAPVRGGLGTTYRALLADDVLHLPSRSVVLRWVHARGALYVGRESTLHNRASSDDRITLSHDVRFERLGAPLIEVVCGEPRASARPRAPVSDAARRAAATAAERDAERAIHRYDGDFELAAGAVLEGDVIARGVAVVRRGASLRGSLKAHRAVVLEDDAAVGGAVVSRESVTLGARSHVGGPVIAEADCVVGRWSQVGTAEAPTSVACRRVTLHAGAVVHGRIAPREGGVACPSGAGPADVGAIRGEPRASVGATRRRPRGRAARA